MQGWIRLIDVLYAQKRFDQAASTLAMAVVACPSLKDSMEVKAIVQALKRSGQTVPA